MDLIPLVYMKNRKIHIERDGDPVSIDAFLTLIEDDMDIYFLDLDGIEKDKPNLCTYQRLATHCNMWVDVGPFNLGDVTDLFMAGADSITIRTKLFPIQDLDKIEEITANKVFLCINSFDKNEHDALFSQFYNIDGVVMNYDKKQIEMEFDSRDVIKRIMNKYKLYVIESEKEKIAYWEKLGVAGVLLDFSKTKDVIK